MVDRTPEDGRATAEEAADEQFVQVPQRLARRIRLALDHAHRDGADSIASYQALAGDLIDCENYPIWAEPWAG